MTGLQVINLTLFIIFLFSDFQVVEVNERFVGHSRPERGDGCCCGALNHNPLTRDRYFGAVGSDSGRVRVIKRLDEPCYLREELPRRGVKSVALCLAFGKQASFSFELFSPSTSRYVCRHVVF